MASFSSMKSAVYSREQRRQQFVSSILGMNALDRHKKFIEDYARFYGGDKGRPVDQLPAKTDQDTLREAYRFIRSEEDDAENTWEQRLAKRYHDKLFKEYCIADMSRYKESKIGLRWRTEKEVVSGKGQFVCGNKKHDEREGLKSYEVNFVYREAGEEKQALVKLRLCPKCAYKLNYRKEKAAEKLRAQEEEDTRSRKRKRGRRGGGGHSSEDEGERRGFQRGSEEERRRTGGEPHKDAAEERRGGGEGGEEIGCEGEQEDKQTGGRGVEMLGGGLPGDESIWLGKRPEIEPNKDEEFDQYFRDMFL